MNDDTLNQLFSALLFRADCPDTMLLGDFQRGLLTDVQQRNAVETHLQTCHHCATEVARLAALTEAVTPQQPSFICQRLDDLSQLVIRLLKPPATAPQLAAVKGHSAELLHEITLRPDETDGVDVAVNVEPTSARLCDVGVRVQIPARWPELAGVRVTLGAESPIAEQETDENGVVRFSDIERSLLESLTLNIHLQG